MAKQKADREDLIREGTAMPIRGRLMIDGNEVVLGFRHGGACSLYWNQDPVFQFDTDGQLRRVFFESNRFKSRNRRLVRLVQPEAGQTATVSRLRLVEETVSEEEQRGILQRAADCLQQIQRHLECPTETRSLKVVGASGDEFRRLVLQWFGRLPQPIRLAEQPSA